MGVIISIIIAVNGTKKAYMVTEGPSGLGRVWIQVAFANLSVIKAGGCDVPAVNGITFQESSSHTHSAL